MPKPAIPKWLFAPIPERAVSDDRLSARHFRILVAVALHDRMSGRRQKGAGCYASNKTLAEKCKVDYASFSTAINELGRWGYVEATPHPLSKRTRVYRIIYGGDPPDDGLQIHKASPDPDTLPEGKHSSADPLPADGQMVCAPNQQAADFIEHPNDNIFSETVRDSAKQQNIHAEASSLRSDGLRKATASQLVEMERYLKQGGDLNQQTVDWLSDISARQEGNNSHHAQRILDEYGEWTW